MIIGQNMLYISYDYYFLVSIFILCHWYDQNGIAFTGTFKIVSPKYVCQCRACINTLAEAFLEPSRTSTMGVFMKIGNGF